MNFSKLVEEYHRQGMLDDALKRNIQGFCRSYMAALEKGKSKGKIIAREQDLLDTLLRLIIDQIQNPYAFPLYHKAERSPFDYYRFGIDFLSTFIDQERSFVFGIENLKEASARLADAENLFFFANHQVEPDPQLIALLLEGQFSQIAEKMICIAGHRVTQDPLAAPLSRGCNILSIWSKRHIDHPPELREQKTAQNLRSMSMLSELLQQGGHPVYVAPSGGRDRPDSNGVITPSAFDAQSVELLLLTAKKSKKPFSIYPLAIKSHTLLPPPSTVTKELGEPRIVCYAPVFVSVGSAISIEELYHLFDKGKEGRQKRAEWLWQCVCDQYHQLPTTV